jgi:hypothetical protein
VKRMALTVGINDYPGVAADLSGCVPDALDWTDVLRRRGYEVRTLLDAEATKHRVVSALNALVEAARWRDRIVFCFSGHGTWVPDTDGDESDGRDEALCCVDYASGGLLTDDELHGIFSRARHGVQITVISDSCHSGTVARDLMALSSAVGTPKFVSPAAIEALPVDRDEAIRREMRPTTTASRPGAVLLSGCADAEYSYDASFGGRANGAFTRVAIDALTIGAPATVASWHRLITQHLPSHAYPQSPQLGASAWQRRRKPLA